jgi:hypothetical protein
VTVVEIVDGSPVVAPDESALLVDPWSLDTPAGLLLDAYIAAGSVHARSPGGLRLAEAPTPERIAAAERLMSEIADQALAAVLESDGVGVLRRQLSGWARWGRAVHRTHEASAQRHDSELMPYSRPAAALRETWAGMGAAPRIPGGT